MKIIEIVESGGRLPITNMPNDVPEIVSLLTNLFYIFDIIICFNFHAFCVLKIFFFDAKKIKSLMSECWNHDPERRPSFDDIEDQLSEL